MIITIASQKGGVGKTTLSILLSNYLSVEKNHSLRMLDYDKQNTADFYYQRQKRDELENDLPYEVEKIEDTNSKFLTNPNALAKLNNSDDLFIIDTAGFLNEGYIEVLKSCKAILIPFNYTESVLHSTIKFSKYCREIVEKKELIFIPNNMQLPRKEYREKVFEAWDGIDSIISRQGRVLKNRIYRQSHMEKISIGENNTWHKKNANDAFEEIYNLIFYTKW